MATLTSPMITELINRLLGSQAPTHRNSIEQQLMRSMQGRNSDTWVGGDKYSPPAMLHPRDYMQYWEVPTQGPM